MKKMNLWERIRCQRLKPRLKNIEDVRDLLQRISLSDGNLIARKNSKTYFRISLPKNSGRWKSGVGVLMGAQERKWGWAVRSPHL